MKRYLILLPLLVILAVGTLSAGHVWLNSARDRMDFTETVLLGDPAAAADLSVIYRAKDRYNHLFWDTAFTPGRIEQAETEFRFSGPSVSLPYTWSSYVDLAFATDNFGMHSSVGLELGLQGESYESQYLILPARDVASRTPDGEARTETVRLADYYAYYPVTFSANSKEYGYLDSVYSGNNDWLQRYFRLKVDEEKMVDVTVEKADDGRVVGLEMRSQKENDAGYIFSEGVTLENGIFLIAESIGWDGKPDGRLQCPAGPGVHIITVDPERLSLDMANLWLFYPTGEARCLRLTASADGTRLHLYTQEADMLVLTVLDAVTGEALQRLELLEHPGDALRVIDQDGLHLAMPESGEFCLVAEEDGWYTPVLRGSFADLDGLDTETKYMLLDSRAPVLAWDGRRMAFGGASEYCSYYNYYKNNICVGVWDASGLCYLGGFDYSLSRDPASYQRLMEYGSTTEPLSLSFVNP